MQVRDEGSVGSKVRVRLIYLSIERKSTMGLGGTLIFFGRARHYLGELDLVWEGLIYFGRAW